MPLLLLFGSMLIIMLMRVAMPVGAPTTGKVVREVRLTLWERVLIQRTNLYAIGFVLVLAAVTGLVGGIWEMVVMGGVLAILTIPMRYRITTDGIAMNNVVFRSWGDFTGVDVKRRHIRLLPKEGQRPFDVRLLGPNQTEVMDVLVSRISPATPKPGTRSRRRRATARH